MAKGIYKRGNIFWIRYAGLDGKIVYESSGSDKFKDANDKLIGRKNDIKDRKQPEITRIGNHTFKELAEKYNQWMEGRHRSADSKKYRINIILSHFGNLSLRHFNTLAVEQYQTNLINKGLKPATVNKHISILKAMIKKAVDWNMVEEETLKRARKVKLLTENNKRLRYLSKEEWHSLVNSCDPHLKPVVVTALNTGARKEEILSLKWDNVDLKHDFILLDKTKNGNRREIPINQTLRVTLQGLTRRLDIPYVFYNPIDSKRYKDIKRSFKTACKRAGITDFRFHDTRHTFASHLVMAGVDITTVKELLGHKTLAMTLRYSHLAPAHMVKAVDILDSTLTGKPTIQKLYNLGVRDQCLMSVSP
jgi:integrase